MKIIVTGGAGFIGSNLVDSLISKGYEVHIIDNLSTGKLENLNKQAYFYNTDITSPNINDIFKQIKPDVLFHLAAQVSVSESIKFPLKDEKTNIQGTVNLLESCRNFNTKKIIYSSSAAVYGMPIKNPISENHPTDPISHYGISKLTPEYYIKLYHHLYGLNYAILRYSNVYGPRQDFMGEGGVISIFLNKILKDDDVVIYGDGNQTRDFIYVKDVVKANIAAIKNTHNGTYNISTNKAVSLNELIDKISRIKSSFIIPKYGNERLGDIRHSCLDNSFAKSELGWEPTYTLTDGLIETIEFQTSKPLLMKG